MTSNFKYFFVWSAALEAASFIKKKFQNDFSCQSVRTEYGAGTSNSKIFRLLSPAPQAYIWQKKKFFRADYENSWDARSFVPGFTND